MGELEEAKAHLLQALAEAIEHKFTRIVIGTQIKLAELDLKFNHLEEANNYLLDCLEQSYRHNDHRNIARTNQILSQLHKQKGEEELARTELRKALDHYERVGMQQELRAVREELGQLL